MSLSYADNAAKIKFIWMVLLIIIMAAPVSASARGMTPEDVARYSYVYQMAISPDGQHIAYTKVVQRNPFTDDDGKAYRELYVADLDGNSRPYITGKERIYGIAWSPDGKYISYLAERKKDNGDEEDYNALYKIPFEGGESEKIIQFKSDIEEYAWAPDGHKIVLLAKDSIPEKMRELEDRGFDQEIYEEDWRPVRVWILDLQDESAVPVPLDLSGSASEISWSPDGSMLAMALAPTSLIDDDYMYRRVTTVDANTGKVVYQFDNPGKLGDIVWSPDSKRLAIISAEDINDPKEGEVYVLKASGGELQPVIIDFEGHVRDIAWIDNNTILYLADENVYSTIGTVKSDGTNRKIIIPTGRPVFEYLTLSENKKDIALRGSSFDYPEELFHLESGIKSQRD
jgi:Tol biopolymer transport system component